MIAAGNSSTHVSSSSSSSSSSLFVLSAAAVATIATSFFTIGYFTAVAVAASSKNKTRSTVKDEPNTLQQMIDDETSGNSICINQQQQQQQLESGNSFPIPAPRRFGACIKLIPEKYVEYRTLHDNVWDQVQKRIYHSNIRNFNIYYHKETNTMYQSYEWIGHWFAIRTKQSLLTKKEEQQLYHNDMFQISQDPITREWWKLCEPCQEPFSQWYDQITTTTNDDDQRRDAATPTTSPSSNSYLPPPSQGNTTGDWWASMECVCHTGHWPIAYSKEKYDPDFVKLFVTK